MTRHMKLYPGAAANDSAQNRRWISQENGRADDPAAGEASDPTSSAAMAAWDDDGGRAPDTRLSPPAKI